MVVHDVRRSMVLDVRRSLGALWGWPPGLQSSSPLLRWLFLLVFADGMLNALYVRPLVGWPALSWTADVLTHVVLPAALLWLAISHDHVRFSDLGFRFSTRDEHGRVVLLVLLISVPVASVIVYALAVEIGQALAPGSRALVKMPSPMVIPAPGLWRTLTIAYLAVSAGLVTELVYRGVLLRIVAPRTAWSWRYLVLSALLFGLIHWESGPSMVIAATLFGAFLAVLYRYSGSIWPSMVGHMAVNVLWISIVLEQL